MNKSASRLFIAISLLVLISLACNKPVLSQSKTSESVSEISESGSDISGESASVGPHNTDGAEITLIPGATFLMGSSAFDFQAEENELPEHKVTLEDFYIYTHEVTNKMYQACVTAGACVELTVLESGPTSHYGSPEFSEYPAVGVDWVMARDYCDWASARLPTEAEWELASRGPESFIYPWGEEEPTCDRVNMRECFDPPDTQPVGNYLMGNSPDGVWDMSGNAWEWVHDWYADDYYSQSPEDNPIGPLEPQDPDNPLRVIRGGGLNSDPAQMRSAIRMGLDPYRTFPNVGIRCVVGEGLVLPDDYDHGEDRHDDDPGGDSGLRSVRLLAGCRTRLIADMVIVFDPAEPVLVDASTDFGPLTCDPAPPPDGVYRCYDLPGSLGDTINLYFSFADGSTINTSVEYPDCSVPIWFDHFCDVDSTGALVPHLVISYPPGDPPGVPAFLDAAASAGGDPSVDLDCVVIAFGTAICTGLPGDAGVDMLGIFASFDDGSALHGSYPHPLCLEMEDLIPPWDPLLSCFPHDDGAAEYRVAIDTNMAGFDFIPGSWTLTGVPIVPEPKNCILENPALNIWGCSFPLGAYGDMEFCAEWVGGSGLHCVSFDGSLLPDDCSEPDDGGGDPETGWCIPGPPPGGGCGTNPCQVTCPQPGGCIPCTLP